MWVNGNDVGITQRTMRDSSSHASSLVASSNTQMWNYTDYHEVDEDMMTSLLQGGLWSNVTDVGITFRFITDSPSNLSSYVASVCRHLKYSSNYTDGHDVDKDIKSTNSYGGGWLNGPWVGIIVRNLYNPLYDTYDTVASLKNIGHSR